MAPAHILVIDDDLSIRRLLRSSLQGTTFAGCPTTPSAHVPPLTDESCAASLSAPSSYIQPFCSKRRQYVSRA